MKTENLKPFNLADAKAGKAVITRSGLDATILDFDFCKDGKKIIAKIIIPKLENALVRVFENGMFWNNGNFDDYDLFMKPEKKIVWVNFYTYTNSPSPQIWGITHNSYEEAMEGIDNNNVTTKFLETKQIEITL